MSIRTYPHMSQTNEGFWESVDRYASSRDDEEFLGEVAYLMVTLHRHGA